ncbi:DsrE/DsrF/TusD sulfur relay family protein [Uliginosibacterium sp. sgz301328]|uniref:DsrE/DsrF/TusD sulfur relay family protein n=1 Tax=Uliginosibacterium sp. sgz301328 TaxID=3243764 RepID=UPI00359DD655
MTQPQRILIIVHAAPYGSERVLSALRLASALAGHGDATPHLRLFFMSDGVTTGLAGQAEATAGGGLQQMIEDLTGQGVPAKLCRTCAVARGVDKLPLASGVEIGTLPELAEWTLWADKVITF